MNKKIIILPWYWVNDVWHIKQSLLFHVCFSSDNTNKGSETYTGKTGTAQGKYDILAHSGVYSKSINRLCVLANTNLVKVM